MMKRLSFTLFSLVLALFFITPRNAQAAGIMNYVSSTATWSVTHGAKYYAVYYGTTKGGPYQHAVRVPDKGTSVTIGYLDPKQTYYYKVAALVATTQVWQDEKVLSAGNNKPVLGTQTQSMRKSTPVRPTPTSRVLGKQTTPTVSCVNTGSARVLLNHPQGVTVARAHLLYGTQPGKYAHAVRNLTGQAREMTVNALNTCSTYYYQVLFVETNGRVSRTSEMILTPQAK